jgi:hypothetical protein
MNSLLGSQKPKIASINMHGFSIANLCQSLIKCQKPINNHWYDWHCQSLKKVLIIDQKNAFGKLSIFRPELQGFYSDWCSLEKRKFNLSVHA